MDKHISLARELGYEGQELRDYLKRQQILKWRKGWPKGNMKERKGRPIKKRKIGSEKKRIEN